MSEKIEISFEDVLNKICKCYCPCANEDIIKNCLNMEINIKTCSYIGDLDKLGITIKKLRSKLEEANKIELVYFINTLDIKSYYASEVDKKISLLMEYIKELESKK